MGLMVNIQGSLKFYCQKTWHKLTRKSWNEMPMPQSIVKKVNRRAKRDRAHTRLTFRNRNNMPYSVISNEEYDKQPKGLV